jgi:hypothetical protein
MIIFAQRHYNHFLAHSDIFGFGIDHLVITTESKRRVIRKGRAAQQQHKAKILIHYSQSSRFSQKSKLFLNLPRRTNIYHWLSAAQVKQIAAATAAVVSMSLRIVSRPFD